MNKNLIKITAIMLSALTFSTVATPSSNAARRSKPPKEITADKKSADNKKPAVLTRETSWYYNRECNFEFCMDAQETNINYFVDEINSTLREVFNISKDARFTLGINNETKKNILCITKSNTPEPKIYAKNIYLLFGWKCYNYFIRKENSSRDDEYEEYTSYINYDKQIVVTVPKEGADCKETLKRLETVLSFTNYIKEKKEDGSLYKGFYAFDNNLKNPLYYTNPIYYSNPNYSMYNHLIDFQQKNNFRSKYCNNSTPIPTQAPTPTPTQAPAPAQTPAQTPAQIPTFTPILFVPNQLLNLLPARDSTLTPIQTPNRLPNQGPTLIPIQAPNRLPNQVPTLTPIITPNGLPNRFPNQVPTLTPVLTPNRLPNRFPTETPSLIPILTPNRLPNRFPNQVPTLTPILTPNRLPNPILIQSPSESPSQSLSPSPAQSPYQSPVRSPSQSRN